MTVIRSGGAPLFGLPPGVVLVLLLAALLCAGCASRNESPENVRSRNLQEDMATLESVALGKFKDKDKPAEPPPASAREPEAVKPARPLLPNPLSLSQAVDYALRNNLQALVAEQERQTLNETANSAMLRMLPSLLAEVEQSWKSRHIPSFSESFKTGQQTLEPSISSDLRTNTYDVTFSWDVLNTAINAIHWRQARKATEAAGERLRRVKQDVALKVTEAYMAAVVAREMSRRVVAVINEAEERTRIIDQEIKEDLVPRIQGLQSRADVMEMRIRFHGFQDRQRAALARLSELLGLPPGESPELVEVDFLAALTPEDLDLSSLEREALHNRPELFERDMLERISLEEADAALLQMFPELTPFASYSYDGNSYLVRHDWFTCGIRLSWDLMAAPEAHQRMRTAQEQAKLERKRRMLMTLAVLTQVRLAVIDYYDAVKKLPLTRELTETRKSLMDLVEEHARAGKLHESRLLEEGQQYLNSWQLFLNSYSNIVVTSARLQNALGREWQGGQWLPPDLAETLPHAVGLERISARQ